MGCLVRMDDYISNNVRRLGSGNPGAHSRGYRVPSGGGGSQSESCLYFFLISSGVAVSLMSRISYGLYGGVIDNLALRGYNPIKAGCV